MRFTDHRGTGRVTHRPDLGLRLGGQPIRVAVELQRKSRARLRAILGMYEELATCDPPRFGGVFYITGASDMASGVTRAAKDVGLGEELVRMRSYEEVIERARAAAARKAAVPPPRESRSVTGQACALSANRCRAAWRDTPRAIAI